MKACMTDRRERAFALEVPGVLAFDRGPREAIVFGMRTVPRGSVSWQLADALQPGSQPTIDPNMWTAWWGTNKPTFPDNDVWNNGGDLVLPLNQNLIINSGDTVTT